MTVLLDASALLAWLFREPGGLRVREVLARAFIAAPNWSEVLQKARFRALDVNEIGAQVLGFGLTVSAVDREDASAAALLWEPGTSLSLADRFCIAVGRRLDLPVWTCDHAFAGVDSRVVVLR